VQISVIGRHMDLSSELRSYVENKVGKLIKYYDRILAVEVILNGEGVSFAAEIIVKTEHGHVFVAKESGQDSYAAVDMVMDKIERQITRHKERTRNRKHKASRSTEAGGEVETSSTT
jgi:putative sigma-54 modulation protein